MRAATLLLLATTSALRPVARRRSMIGAGAALLAPAVARADKPDADASSLSVNAPMLMAMQSFPGMQGMQGFPGMLPVPLMAMMPGFDPAEFLASAMNHAQQASSKEENGDES